MRRRRVAGVLVALGVLAPACSSSREASGTVPPTVTAPPATTPGTSTTSAPTTTASPSTTTVAGVDPTWDDTPVGACDTIAPGAIGFRNETGHLADRYEPIGESSEGRTIWAEHWGPVDGPQVLVLGQVHGDECAPAWFVQAIRDEPPTEFGIWLVPTANPDGLAAHTRRTAEGIDPNRDGFLLATPEARAVMAVTEMVHPVLTLHVHSPYRWVGAHNGGIAVAVATALSEAAGWGYPRNAGRVEHDDLAFLWEGQERTIPGHPSVLIELPAVAEAESPAPPDPAQKVVTSVADVAAVAVAMRDALYSAVPAALAPVTDG